MKQESEERQEKKKKQRKEIPKSEEEALIRRKERVQSQRIRVEAQHQKKKRAQAVVGSENEQALITHCTTLQEGFSINYYLHVTAFRNSDTAHSSEVILKWQQQQGFKQTWSLVEKT